MALYKTNFPDGFISSATPSVISVVGVHIETFILTSTDIVNGFVVLASTPATISTVAVDWNGIDQYYSFDYTISINQVVFSLNLLNNMDVGDIVKIAYQ